jgi:hypothetical protein
VNFPEARVARLGLAVFALVYVAYDALAGVATGVLATRAAQASPEQRRAYAQAAQALFDSAPTWTLYGVGSAAWLLALMAAGLALRRQGRRTAPVLLLAAAAALFAYGHAFPTGPLAMLCLLGAALLLIWRGQPPVPAASRRSSSAP